MISEKVRPHHLERKAILYVRHRAIRLTVICQQPGRP